MRPPALRVSLSFDASSAYNRRKLCLSSNAGMMMFDKFRARGFLIVYLGFCANSAIAADEPAGKTAERLLVVAPKQFALALEKFMQHKAKLLNATLKPLEEILAES